MSIYEYDEEKELKLIRADERELGIELGKEYGREEERKNTEIALKQAEENKIKMIVSLCKEYGSTKEETAEKLIEKCNLTKEEAIEKVNLYWDKES